MQAVRFSVLAGALLACPSLGQPGYPGTPDWVSADTPYSTGGALVDLDRDGWQDFVVANGNDIRREELVVYYNQGDGTLPTVPDWASADSEYNGHLSVADVNGDGWQDVAVALTLDGDGTPTARLYLNNAGTLSESPDWVSPDALAGFHVAFGDVNGDGRPDLAVGTGFPYTGTHRWHNYVYMNVGGSLEATASWVSADTWDYMDVFFCDVDRDGWLDLVAPGTDTDTWVYLNDQGVLATTAGWRTVDNPGQYALMGTYGDVDEDGWVDLFVADNTQLVQGSGLIRRYNGLDGGLFETTPSWSFYEEYGSAVALADIDGDGDLDLATGGWWGRTRYFLNVGGGYATIPDWSSSGSSVVEAIVFGDVNRDGLRVRRETFDVSATPGRHLFSLERQPIERIDEVTVDGVPLGHGGYTFDAVHGWVSVGIEALVSVSVRYVYSVSLDMAITNWDDSLGNYLYYNRSSPGPDGDFDGDEDVDANDLDSFLACFSGAGGGPVDYACLPGDFDLDGDVDCDDWDEFRLVWTGGGDPPPIPGCGVAPPMAPPYPYNRAMNRYLSFSPNEASAGEPIAFLVKLTSLELGSCSASGAPCRLGHGGTDCGACSVTGEPCLAASDCQVPGQSCEPTGQSCINDLSASVGKTWWIGPDSPEGNGVHLLVSEPFRQVSTSWPAVIQVGDCEIVPNATYGVRAANTATGALSDELSLATIARPGANYWADGVGPLGDYCTGTWAPCPNGVPDCPSGESCNPQWSPPDGATNFDDVTATVFLFQSAPGRTVPDVTWVDMHGDDGGDAMVDPPNYIANFADIQFIVLAFQGRPYPFLDPADCPDVGEWP